MTSDKQTNGKPFTPTLSAAFYRANNSPLTPKLASSNNHLIGAKRGADYDVRSDESTPTPASSATYLSANVTPRSGPRTSRREAARSSPAPTPASAHQSSPVWVAQPSATASSKHSVATSERSPVGSIGTSELPRTLKIKKFVTDDHHLSIISRPNPSDDTATDMPMFFHASDAKSTVSSDNESFRLKPYQGTGTTTSTFVYANGDQENESPMDDNPIQRRSIGSSQPIASAKSNVAVYPHFKSPKTPEFISNLPNEVRSQLSLHQEDTSDICSQPQVLLLNNWHDKLRSTPSLRHMKSSSLDFTHPKSSTSKALRASPILVSCPALQDGRDPHSSPELHRKVSSNRSSVSDESSTLAPIISGSTKPEGKRANGTVVNARTERKILDLEISNSSLLAINRTLEREMRKQNAELRRYRRLSRSGRLSVAPTQRSVSGPSLAATSEADENASKQSSPCSPDALSESSDTDSIADDGILSPDYLAEHDARHRAHDERKFFIDLAKHRELLIDSQKMNQSLKRCLGWTEELIKEGRKALEYQVHVSDVELGGRVLGPEELSDIEESSCGLLSPSHELPDMLGAVDLESPNPDT